MFLIFFNLVSSSRINKRSYVGLKGSMHEQKVEESVSNGHFLLFGAFRINAIFTKRWRYIVEG